MIPDILPLFRARFRIFWWILYFKFSSALDLKLLFPSFAQDFGFFHKLILCPSVRARFGVLLKNDTSILFRLRFEVDLWFVDTSILFRPRFQSWSWAVICSPYWAYTWRPVELIFVPAYLPVFQISSYIWTYPQLPVLFNFHFFFWTYSRVPVFQTPFTWTFLWLPVLFFSIFLTWTYL